ncbi:MAG: nitroreductase [Candidatus Binatia bacterium]|nr:MAG: nitroreductase [Candidatus Binatia bacterium]
MKGKARDAPQTVPGKLAARGFFDVALSQRAQRELLPDPVPEETIERILEAAIHAPSAENRQPWVFVVVREEEARRRIAELTARIWGQVREAERERIGPGLFRSVDRWATDGLARAPVLVVVCGDTSLAEGASLAASVYPATQNLCLAATALGLGSVFSTLPTASPELGEVLGLPPHIRPMALVPLGFPARALRPPRRIPVREKAHRERYGRKW